MSPDVPAAVAPPTGRPRGTRSGRRSRRRCPVIRSTGPALLERPRTDDGAPTGAIPAVPAVVGTNEAPAGGAPGPAVPEEPADARRRLLPRPPGRRGPVWLAALVAGAVVAALPSTLGSDAAGLPVSAADYGL